MENKDYFEEMKTFFEVTSLEDVALKLGYSAKTASTWRSRGLTKSALNKFKLIKSKNNTHSQDSFIIPVLSITASAGPTGNQLDSIDIFDTGKTLSIDRAIFRTPPAGTVKALEIDGDSMEPKLRSGDWVLFDETNHYDGDGLYVISYAHTLMVKQLQADLSTGKLHIRSTNPAYDSYTIDPSNQEHFRIIGKVLRSIT